MRNNGGFYNFKVINLGNIKNVTKEEAHHTEQAFINLFKPNMNTINSYVTDEEKIERNIPSCRHYYENHKEQNQTKCKEYRKPHKEEIRSRELAKTTCECGSIVVKYKLERHKKSNKRINLMKNNVPPISI